MGEGTIEAAGWGLGGCLGWGVGRSVARKVKEGSGFGVLGSERLGSEWCKGFQLPHASCTLSRASIDMCVSQVRGSPWGLMSCCMAGIQEPGHAFWPTECA